MAIIHKGYTPGTYRCEGTVNGEKVIGIGITPALALEDFFAILFWNHPELKTTPCKQ